MVSFKIAETENYSKKVNSKKFNDLYQIISENVYPILKSNPFYSGNIKKLKGEYMDIYRFRIGNYKLFYKIDEKKSLVFIINIEN